MCLFCRFHCGLSGSVRAGILHSWLDNGFRFNSRLANKVDKKIISWTTTRLKLGKIRWKALSFEKEIMLWILNNITERFRRLLEPKKCVFWWLFSYKKNQNENWIKEKYLMGLANVREFFKKTNCKRQNKLIVFNTNIFVKVNFIHKCPFCFKYKLSIS